MVTGLVKVPASISRGPNDVPHDGCRDYWMALVNRYAVVAYRMVLSL